MNAPVSIHQPPIIVEGVEDLTFDNYREIRGALSKIENPADSPLHGRMMLVDKLCSFTMNPDNDSKPFGPSYQSPTERSAIPQDLSDDEIEQTKQLAQDSPSALIKARAADVLWHLNIGDRPFDHAMTAAVSYLEAYNSTDDKDKWIHLGSSFKRGLKLAKKQGVESPVYRDYIHTIDIQLSLIEADTLYADAHFYFAILARNKEPNYSDYASRCEAIAQRLRENENYHLSHQYLNLAQQFHRHAKDDAAEDRCKITEGESLIEYATKNKEAKGALAATQPLASAVKLLEQTTYSRETLAAHRETLIAWQKDTISEMKSSEFTTDIADIVKGSIKQVKRDTLEDAIFAFAVGWPSLDTKALRERVEEQRETCIAHFLFSTSIIADDGRVIANQADLTDAECEDAIEQEMYRQAQMIDWPFRGQGYIHPARCEILNRFHPSAEDLFFLIRGNPFIRPGHEEIFLRGIMAGFEGDFLISSHLLVPQIEESIRYLLQQNGVVTSKLDDHLVQDERSLGTLLSFPETIDILGEKHVFEIRGLLCSRFGFNLRNRIAHGMLPDHGFHSHASDNIWWLVLKLLCIPLIKLSEAQNGEAGGEAETDTETPHTAPTTPHQIEPK